MKCKVCQRERVASPPIRTMVVWLMDGESVVISPEEKNATVCQAGWLLTDPSDPCTEALLTAERICRGCPETAPGRFQMARVVFTDTTTILVARTEGEA